ncbi:MAG: DUF5131 family protein [Pseudomonadota bacterium]
MNRTKIEWTDYTWNPITGCKGPNGSPCPWCWARRQIVRQKIDFEPRFHGDRLEQPLRVKKPAMIFAVSMGDLFSEGVARLAQDLIWHVMTEAHWHTFLVLTKRPDRMREYVQGYMNGLKEYADKFAQCPTEAMRNSPAAKAARKWAESPPSNIWLGVSITNQADADTRIPLLLQTPATKHFVSYEPALGEVDFDDYLYRSPSAAFEAGKITWDMPAWARIGAFGLDWLIAGAMSGPSAVPPQSEWFDAAKEACERAGVAYFEKSSLAKVVNRPLIQQWPEVAV